MSTPVSFIISGGNTLQREKVAAQLIQNPEMPLIDSWRKLKPKTTIAKGESQKPQKTTTDILFLEAENGSIGVTKIRDLKNYLRTKPAERLEKIAVIKEAQNLTVEAQNALLKTLEEPPEQTALILLVTTLDTLLPTISSRCLTVVLPDAQEDLRKTQPESSPEILDKAGLPGRFDIAAKFTKDSAEVFLDSLLTLLHHQLVATNNPKIIERIDKIFLAKSYLSANTNVRLTLENLFLNW